jgi:plastocyanin
MSRRGVRWLGLALSVLSVLAGCGDARPSAPTAADLQAIDVSPDHTITVDDRGFEPATLTVAPGDVIRIVNEGAEAHSVTADDQRFDARLLPGDDTTLVLTEPGAVAFRDVNRPEHTGTLTVTTPG